MLIMKEKLGDNPDFHLCHTLWEETVDFLGQTLESDG